MHNAVFISFRHIFTSGCIAKSHKHGKFASKNTFVKVKNLFGIAVKV